MGVDLFAVIGHNYKFKEILELQFRIESDKSLKDLYWWKADESINNWSDLISEQSLEELWEHNERQEEDDANEVFQYNDLYLPTFFGCLTFHRHIVELEAFGLRLWTLEMNSEMRQKILSFYARLAEILYERIIIYYGDSWASSSWIHSWVYSKTINEILNRIEENGKGQIPIVEESIKKEHLFIQKII